MINYIYTLTDPIDGKIKYIGKAKSLKNRISRHISDYYIKKDPWTNKNKWIKWLKNQNIKPIIEILDEGDESNINDLERYWIAQFKTWGFKLKNMTDGGDGIDWTGKKHSKETRDKLKKNNPLKKTVVLFDKNFNPLKQFISVRDAERESGVKRHQIKLSCNKDYSCGGCYFKYSSILIKENSEWKSFIQMRDYNKVELNYENCKYACENSKNIREFAKLINISINGKAKAILFEVVKKFNLDISHFTFKQDYEKRRK